MTTLVPKTPTVIAGVIFVLVMTMAGIFAPLVAPHDPTEISMLDAQLAPGEDLTYLLGTDIMGRDMLSRLIYGYRFEVFFGVLALLLGAVSSLVLVRVAARSSVYHGTGQLPSEGFLNYSLLRMAGLILLIGPSSGLFVVVILGAGLFNLALVVTPFAAILPLSLIYCSVRNKLALSASSIGENAPGLPVRIALRECMVLLPITYSLAFLMGLFLETPLSFLGVGVPPGGPGLGIMISEGRSVVLDMWWLSLLPLGVVALAGGAFLAILLPIRRVQKQSDLFLQHDPTFCPQCGSQVGVGYNFCIECRTELVL